MDLKNYRSKIDRVDKKITELLNERAHLVEKISEVKKGKNLHIFQPSRHHKILKKILRENKGPLSEKHLENIFTEILSACLELQHPMKVAYLGPQGTFTHQAAIKKFGRSINYVTCNDIRKVFAMVASHDAHLGVVPIENSIEGVVNHTLDMFVDSNLKICSEIILKISLCLLSNQKSLKGIKKVYSHPQVFGQAKGWLETNLPQATYIPCSSTSQAAKLAKREKNAASVGSQVLSEIYNLNVLHTDVQDYLYNVTRFLVISREDSLPTGDDKTSLVFATHDKPGALFETLKPFKASRVNLTKIESRPSRRRAWEYFFFVDFEGHRENKKIKNVLNKLAKELLFLKILGSYPREK